MKVLFWNVRGVRREEVVERIREEYKCSHFEVLCLAEPKIKPKLDTVLRMGLKDFSSNNIHNGEGDSIPNLWIIYRAAVVIDKIQSSRQQITVLVGDNVITAVHAKSRHSMRRELWQQMEAMKCSRPWLVLGDFNCVLQYAEKKGGRMPSLVAIQEFREAMDRCELVEADTIGTKFSWSNNKEERDRIISRIDRAFTNMVG